LRDKGNNFSSERLCLSEFRNALEIDKQVMVHLDERTRRIYAGGLAKKYGYGRVSKVHHELELDHKTIRRGMKELEQEPLKGRIRKEGAGRSWRCYRRYY